MNKVNNKKPYDLTSIVAFIIILVSLFFMLLLYIYQEMQLNENIKKTGYSILNSLVTDTRHSLQKGERNTFQGVLDQVKSLQDVQSVSLYNNSKLMTYKSNEMTVGFPFIKIGGKLINPNEELYAKTNGHYTREDWSFNEQSMKNHADKLKKYKAFENVKSSKCSECHYTLNENLQFDLNHKTHIINKDLSYFYYNIPVERNCVNCHTHWEVGNSAGYLSIVMNNKKITTQSNNRLRYFFTILVIVIISFLIIGYFIKALNKKLQSTQKKLKDQANHDPMTGLFNRRYLYSEADKFINISKQNNQDIYFIMFDIDNFKSINDTYGHDIGDKVIIALSNEVLKCTRKSDVATRWGGEEFLILLSNTDQKGAKILAEKIRANIETLEVENIKFTVSIGISNFDYSEDNHVDDAIKKADSALYQAKETGKNRVCQHI